MSDNALQELQRFLSPQQPLLRYGQLRGRLSFARTSLDRAGLYLPFLGILPACWVAVLLVGLALAAVLGVACSPSRASVSQESVPQAREMPPLPPEITTLAEQGRAVFGPSDGSLNHKGMMYMDYKTASPAEPRSMVVEARFYHPQACSKFPWDIGFVFRRDAVKSYALWIDCVSGWGLSLSDRDLSLWIPIDRGTARGLDVSAGGSNHLKLIAVDGRGYMLLNDRPAASLDISDLVEPGKIDIAVNFSHSNQQPGKSTRYEGFTVRSLDEVAGTAARSRGEQERTLDVQPAAPSSGRILFTRKLPREEPLLFTMKPDGSDLRQLAGLGHTPGHASWSPDGTKIVWDGHGGTEGSAIFTMNADGSEVRRITESKGYKYGPMWSPDGRKIAFYATPANALDHNSDIWVVNADGTGESRLTTHPETDVLPAWSPDSRRIAFTSGRTGNSEIFVMDADGRNQKIITDHPASDTAPDWSPDGTKLAFVSDRSGQSLIHTMKSDGTNAARLTGVGRAETNPIWSPDGKMIAYSSLISEGSPPQLGYNIFVIGADGSNIGRTTSGRSVDVATSWGK